MATSSMSQIFFENGSTIYVGNTVYRNVQLTDVTEDYREQDVFTVDQTFVARGVSANNFYYDEHIFEEALFETYQDTVARALREKYGMYNYPTEFKSINYVPKNNQQAKRRLVQNPEDL